ncbi:phosphoribosylglycinamide formyltransferase [Pseudodesulfovibrio sp.]|uniref:phosphoribosylglycinamide formyltransferase n=1 Tax=unclassified Pseudodesulfovibrio TaxID=2661612 RepID=UPI003AFFB3E0
MKLPIAVLISGSGSNLQSIINRIEAGVLDAEIKLVLCNKPGAFGIERAKKHNLPYKVMLHDDYRSREDFDRAMIDAIIQAGVGEDGLVVMAGFMRIVTPLFLSTFQNRVINIHPSLLPSFPGVNGQAEAADYGVKIAGCTVHFVDEQMDNGPVVIQAAVPCQADEDGNVLAPRILKMEHRIYPQAIQWYAENRLRIVGRHVELKVSGRTRTAQPKADIEPETYALVWPPLENGF